MQKIHTNDDVYEGIMKIEKYFYVERAKGRIPDDIFTICMGLIDMCKNTVSSLSSVSTNDINLVELENDGSPKKIIDCKAQGEKC